MGSESTSPAVAALAGRRIDAPDALESRFPSAEEEYVSRRLNHRFRMERVDRLVCSGACGADILALEVAERLAIPATLVLPFAVGIFRQVSVADRPGDWGPRFDALVNSARNRGTLIELGLPSNSEDSFIKANERIIQLASMSGHVRRLAFVVWEGQRRGNDDATADFLRRATLRGFIKRTVQTTRRTI